MTYFELVDAVRAAYAGADAGNIKEHVAFQFNVTGEAEGIFYLEIKDGEVIVEPYDYHDRDVLFTTTAETLLKIGRGELDPMWAYTTRKLRAEGNLGKALLLKEIKPKRVSGLTESGEVSEAAKTDKMQEASGSAKTDKMQEACGKAEACEMQEACGKAEACEMQETDGIMAEQETAEAVENSREQGGEEDIDEQALTEEDAAAGDEGVPAAMATGDANDRAAAGKKRPNRKSKKKRR